MSRSATRQFRHAGARAGVDYVVAGERAIEVLLQTSIERAREVIPGPTWGCLEATEDGCNLPTHRNTARLDLPTSSSRRTSRYASSSQRRCVKSCGKSLFGQAKIAANTNHHLASAALPDLPIERAVHDRTIGRVMVCRFRKWAALRRELPL